MKLKYNLIAWCFVGILCCGMWRSPIDDIYNKIDAEGYSGTPRRLAEYVLTGCQLRNDQLCSGELPLPDAEKPLAENARQDR